MTYSNDYYQPKLFQLGYTNVNRPDFEWLNDDSRLFLQRGYLLEGTTALDRIRFIAEHAERKLGIEGYADKFYYYMGRGYFSLSSPIWSNFGLDRGLPISCFGSYIGDSIHEIMVTTAEVGMMSKIGGGTSAYFGDIRPRGSLIKNNGKSDGSFNFSKLFDTVIDVISQGTSRKGQFAGYIDIEHGDIDEWLDIHTEGNPIQLMYYGVCVGHDWLESMKAGDPYKRQLWAKILQRKTETGIPYLFFKDNANAGRPDVYKDKNMTVHASNLCTEIMLPSNNEESFVCCLSSMNLLYFDEWKDTDAPEVLTYFLDVVMSEFIEKSENMPFLDRANRFAKRHRALGIGVLGWHSYLQANNIAFDSFEAMQKNNIIFKTLQEKTLKASKELAQRFGEPELLKGYGRRNTTLMSIAPTKSSSFILGSVSPSVEPFKSNYYVKDLAKIKTVYKNPFLEQLLKEKGLDTEEIWDSILLNDGSVQHLTQLSEHEKEVFKTFSEISQLSVIQQAAQRQKYIDQGQSINIMVHPATPARDLNQLYLTAEELGLKSIYYQYSMSAAQVFNRNLLSCSSCEA
ncbi:ribonucleoside-diphosphate reductase subunit alpha [Glaesserella parasuis]|uniref:Ribonucleoside-diphosphate reductase subunit alpha n=1 Tax=Glaesserella parasuis TaxID=738 RepID=A0A084F0Q5_GLAPU|nr:ribonucleoside-diphosphate reductase subunit alpha [Glaesserella parasuis]EQA00821.1 ribonucleoside-diphosphate reductase, alpha chain [Glaesserella parasuis MN-H]EQA01981.1 ribonucleoside-diphosphate reductase, alpha chain [Glaesserella parasuis SW114]EQA05362.1 ribonucleoside-diphosphate reductase, alpha chain [Glaesserella parasuis 12939]AMW16427.1 ribonucleotide-diphosphate reductase subunit alpha [Glaesserella parasuis]ATW42659.1 ribonucleoside-diphosphate reductase, alpha chain [Glaes